MIETSTMARGSPADQREALRVSKLHELKSWPDFFNAILAGQKRHDLRRADDRDFQVGDLLLLREFDPRTERYTGRQQEVEITYITSSDQPCALSHAALLADFCILSIAPRSGLRDKA